MVLYKASKHAFFTEGESLTEPEHKDSCDINKMLKNAARGLQVRGGGSLEYGFDDTTMDAMQHRIQKQQLEKELQKTAKTHEFSEQEIQSIPKSIQEKFGFKIKKAAKEAKNDDKTTKNADTQQQTKETKESTESTQTVPRS